MSSVWLWLPVVGPIKTSTVAAAVVMFAAVVAVQRDPIRGLVAVLAWASVFEIVYRLVGVVGFHWPLANTVWQTAAVAGWVLLAAVLHMWPDWRLTTLFIVIMGAWIATGFHSNVPGAAAPIDIRDEVLNEAAKTALALAYLIGALRVKQDHLKSVRQRA